MSPDDYFDMDSPRRRRQKEEEEQPVMTPKPVPRAFSNLSDVDMNQELASQIAEATAFRDHILENSQMFQPNHVTDTIKTCNTLLAQAVKMQESVQTMQRMKAFEDAVIETMKKQPEEVKTVFFALLKEALK